MDSETMSISEIKSLAILAGDLEPCKECNALPHGAGKECMRIYVKKEAPRIRYCSCSRKEVFEGGLRTWLKNQTISKTA